MELQTASVAKVLDYENVVGQDSITRLDERKTSNKKKKKRNTNKSRPQPENAAAAVKIPDAAIKELAVKQPEGAPNKKEPNPQNKNRNRNRRFNNNKPKPNE